MAQPMGARAKHGAGTLAGVCRLGRSFGLVLRANRRVIDQGSEKNTGSSIRMIRHRAPFGHWNFGPQRISVKLQSGVGCEMLSITRNSTGPRWASSLSPNCSCTAVKIDGPSGVPAAASGAGAQVVRSPLQLEIKCAGQTRAVDNHPGHNEVSKRCRNFPE